MDLISKALVSLGVPATVNCRYDIVIEKKKISGVPATVNCRDNIVTEKKKISGSAYKLINSSAYHHGTMLINSNLSNLSLALNPKKLNLQGGGIDSVRSMVTNATEHSSKIDHDLFCDAVIQQFHQAFPSTSLSPEIITIKDISDLDPDVIETAKKLQSKEWIFGIHFGYY